MKKFEILEASSGVKKLCAPFYFSIGDAKHGFKSETLLASKTLPACVIFAWNGQAFCVFRAIEGSEPAWCPSLALTCYFWPRAGPAQPQPQNCKASLLYLTSGGVGFTRMEVRTDVAGKLQNWSVAAPCWEGSQAKIILDSDVRKNNFGPKQ